MKLTATLRLYLFGALLLVALIICAHRFSGHGEAFPVLPLSIAGVAYLLAVRELFCAQSFRKHVVVVGLTIAALSQVAFLAIPTGSDDDVRRYVWDGRLQRLGYNPYIVVPGDPAVATFHTAETRAMNHLDSPTLYPPGAELFFRAVAAIHESTFAMRLALAICNLAIVLILLDVLRSTGQGMHWILAYAWNPLLTTAVAGSGHVDIVGALLLLVSFAALLRRWRGIAAVTFAMAVAVKFLPIVLLPLYWRRVRIRDTMLAAIVFALLYVPFLDHGRIPIGSLGTYLQSFRFNGPPFAMLEAIATPPVAAGFAALAGVAIAIWFRTRHDNPSADAFAWPMAATLLCAPVVYPWYLLWLLPFARSIATLPLILWTVSVLPTYIVWHLRALGNPWILPGWVMWLEYGSAALTAAIILLRRRMQSGTPQRPTR